MKVPTSLALLAGGDDGELSSRWVSGEWFRYRTASRNSMRGRDHWSAKGMRKVHRPVVPTEGVE
jgi:hypothetical protein